MTENTPSHTGSDECPVDIYTQTVAIAYDVLTDSTSIEQIDVTVRALLTPVRDGERPLYLAGLLERIATAAALTSVTHQQLEQRILLIATVAGAAWPLIDPRQVNP